MKTYPIMLDVRGRRCVVAGAGPVGRRKAASLAAAGAAVRLVDPAADDAAIAGVEVVRTAYRPAMLDGALLVLACTADADLNARIASDARSAGALVNVADDPDRCDFFAPAVAADGDVVLAVGTGGASPALAADLAEALARRLPDRVGEFAEALRRVRQYVRQAAPDPRRRRDILRRLSGDAGRRAFAETGPEGLMTMARTLIEAD